jgi:transcription elongation factor GreA
MKKRAYRLSREGKKALQNRISSLLEERLQTANRMHELKDQQSLADSTAQLEVSECVNSLQLIDKEVQELKDILASARIISRPKIMSRVGLGSKVELSGNKGKMSYTIVSSLEADPSKGKISEESPLGKALLGKGVNDEVQFSPRPNALTLRFKLIGIA